MINNEDYHNVKKVKKKTHTHKHTNKLERKELIGCIIA